MPVEYEGAIAELEAATENAGELGMDGERIDAPVAVLGRVWVQADNTGAPIDPIPR